MRGLNLFKRRPGQPSIPSVWRLLVGSLRSYCQHWPQLFGVVAVVALPSAILSLVVGSAVTELLTAYISFATAIMNVALIWAIIQLESSKPSRIRTAYYGGTGSLVKFILVVVVLVLELIPLAFGALLFNSATAGATQVVALPERLLVGSLWLVLAIPSFWLVVRSCFAIFGIFNSSRTPVQALRHSRLLVKHRAWAVFGRLIFITASLVLITLIPTILVIALVPSKLVPASIVALQLLVSLTLLPILYLYFYKLYAALIESSPS